MGRVGYSFGKERGAYLVFDLIDEGVRGGVLRELALSGGVEAAERFEASEQGSR